MKKTTEADGLNSGDTFSRRTFMSRGTAALSGMIVWAALAFVATVIVVARRRTASAKSLLQASPALA